MTPAPNVNAALRCRARSLPRARGFLILASRANGQGSPLPLARSEDQDRARRAAHQLLGDAADQNTLAAAPSVRSNHDQVNRLIFGVVDEFLNRRADHGKGEDLL